MTKTVRTALLGAALAAVAGALTLGSASGAASDWRRFEAHFQESNASITNRIADLGVFQLVNTGSGTVDGFGPATMTMSVTQDRSVQPCGPGSWTNAAVRRIVVAGSTLILRELTYVCQTAAGPVASGRWYADGPSSTGSFAGATGRGEVTVHIPTASITLTGLLRLAAGGGRRGR